MIKDGCLLKASQILIVDKMSDSLQSLKKIMKEAGYYVWTVDSVQGALSFIEIQKPDLIIINLFIQGMDGYALCKYFKNNPNISGTPLIHLADTEDTKTKVIGLQFGCDDFITKPYEPLEIITRLKNYLALKNLRSYRWESSRIYESDNAEIQRSINEACYESIFEQASVGICSTSLDGRFLRANTKFCDILGYGLGELLQKSFSDITHPADLRASQQLMSQLLNGTHTSMSIEKRYIKKNGDTVWVNLSASILRDRTGSAIMFNTIIYDITDKKRAEQSMRLSEDQYMSIFDQSPFGIAVTDSITGQFLKANAKFEEITGRPAEELLRIDWMSITHPDDLKLDHDSMDLFNEKKVKYFSIEKRYIRPDASIVWIDMNISPFKLDGERNCCLCMIIDITEKKMKESQISFMKNHDVLTGLYNRTYLDEIKDRLSSAQNLPLSIISGDINGLSLVNETLGYGRGDAVLKETAAILQNNCKESDVIARIGGDEFLILMPNTEETSAKRIIDQINCECAEYNVQFDNNANFISLSLGFATMNSESEDILDVMKTAERCMNKYKLLEQKSIHSSFISFIKIALSERNHETQEHAERLVKLSKMLGSEVGLEGEQLNELELLASLHDIGKISIDDSVLNKPGKLSEEEWAEMKKHPEIGFRIAMASPELNRVAEFILYHHERWDGKGYPKGAREDEIPLLSRIIAIVDSYDAMTQDRPYRKAMSPQIAIEEIELNAGTQFDPGIAEMFVRILRSSNGEI